MGIVIQVNGNSAGDGFLVVPDGARIFAVPLHLSTNDGSTVSATIDVTPNGAGVTLPGGTINIGPAGMDIPINATAVSNTRGDTVINVHVGGATTTFALTAISNPEIWFRGRFEARFATDGDYYNNPRGNDGGTIGNSGVPGWTWALEGEPDFVPANTLVDPHASVPNPIDKPVGRVMRYNNPVALRSFVAPVMTTVNEIQGLTLSGREKFSVGDPVIGATVNLGPNTYLAANFPPNPNDPPPAEPPPGQDIEGNEPMALFEFHIDGFFSGKSATLADRPTATNFTTPLPASDNDEKAAIGWVPLAAFEANRLTQLRNAFNALSPANQTGTVAGRNLATRIAHLTPNSTTLPGGWDGKEEYVGQVNDSITFQSNTSSVLSYLADYSAFNFFGKHLAFHSDELCGHIHGNLTANVIARLVKDCVFITDRNTFGKDEIDAMLHVVNPAVISAAFYIEVDGFRPSELGISASDLSGIPSVNPAIVPHSPVSGMTIGDSNGRASALLAQDTTLPPSPQRFTWVYAVTFSDTTGFVAGGETVTLTASIGGVSGNAQIQLTEQANVYEIDGPISWLSTDTRVFMAKAGESWFQAPSLGTTPVDASNFIKAIINNLNSGNTGGQTFDSLPLDENGSSLALYQVDSTMTPVFNFALARVRYRSLLPPDAHNVRVFFRLCPALSVSVDYNPNTTYRRSPILNPDGQPIPVLGVQSGNLVTLPFFAEPRKDASVVSMDMQTDPANVQTINHDASGNEVVAYFGCWLDINQPQSSQAFYPLNPVGDGPYSGNLNTILQLVRNQHQCLLAEIAFDPDPITGNPSPGVSDKLAQRNLSLVLSDNPGDVASRRIPNTFELKPTPLKLEAGDKPDELLIEWGNTPAGSTAQIYIPAVTASEILDMASRMYTTSPLTRIDDHTLQCNATGITYVPIPPGTDVNYPGLFTIDLPAGVRRGQLFKIVVRQVTNATGTRQRQPVPQPAFRVSRRGATKRGVALVTVDRELRWRRVLGSFQISIPVGTAEVLLPPEEQLFSILRYIQESIPVNDRWYPVFDRYVSQIGQRVSGFGGDPGAVLPSPIGMWQHPKKGHPGGKEHKLHAGFTGKVDALIYDRFGDFEGFLLNTEDGEHNFTSREHAIEELVRRAWRERILITVLIDHDEPHQSRHPVSLILRGTPKPFEY